jgi:CRISPR-associated endoribonuclease Cas6
MRVRIIFSVLNRGGLVPFHHQMVLSEFVKTVLRTRTDRPFLPDFYNYSGLKGQSRVTRDGLFYDSSKITLVFSSPDTAFVYEFVEALFAIEQVYIGTLLLRPVQVLKEIPGFTGEEIKYVCISPIVTISEGLPNGELKRFINPEEPAFSDLLYDSTLSRMESSGKYHPDEILQYQHFRFVPDLEYLAKARAQEKKFSRIYQVSHRGRETEVRGYTLPFVLHAAPEVHEFIFHSGLGEETQEGFGMVDFSNRDTRTRVEPLVNRDYTSLDSGHFLSQS